MLQYTLSVEGYTEPSRFPTGFYPDEFGFFRKLDVPTNHHCNYEKNAYHHGLPSFRGSYDQIPRFLNFMLSSVTALISVEKILKYGDNEEYSELL